MKAAIFGVLVLLSGCASTWEPATLAPKTIEIQFLSEKEWSAYQNVRKGCEDCFFQYEWILGTADWSGDTCIVRFPSERGMPSRETMTHEIRHCYQEGHGNWR